MYELNHDFLLKGDNLASICNTNAWLQVIYLIHQLPQNRAHLCLPSRIGNADTERVAYSSIHYRPLPVRLSSVLWRHLLYTQACVHCHRSSVRSRHRLLGATVHGAHLRAHERARRDARVHDHDRPRPQPLLFLCLSFVLLLFVHLFDTHVHDCGIKCFPHQRHCKVQ